VKRVIFVLTIAISWLSSTDTRINSLGGIYELLIDDETIVSLFPSRVTEFNKIYLMEYSDGESVNYFSGFHKVGPVNIGLYLNYPKISSYGTPEPITGNGFEIIGGFLDGSLKLGGGVSFAVTEEAVYIEEVYINKVRSLGLKAGVTFPFGVDLSSSIGFRTSSYKRETYKMESKPTPSFSFRTRWVGKGKDLFPILALNFSSWDFSYKLEFIDRESITNKGSVIELIFGLNIPKDERLFLVGLKAGRGGREYTESESIHKEETLYMSVISGIEKKMGKYFTLRAGLHKNLYTKSLTKVEGEKERSFLTQEPLIFYIGAGIRKGVLGADILIDNSTLRLPYFITGQAETFIIKRLSLNVKMEL
jgi:hypothetical protein